MEYRFCPQCGLQLQRRRDLESIRPYCTRCDRTFYRNPIVGVAVLLVTDGDILLVKRTGSYEGTWCIPCGYLEYEEEIRAATARELREETGLMVEVGAIMAVHSNFHDPLNHTVGTWFEVCYVRGDLAPGDDADRAQRQVLAQVTRLAQFDPSPESRLTLVLAGDRERLGRIGQQLLELTELRIDVEPWEQADTEDFLNCSLARAGCQSPVSADPAVARLHELSHGIPRRITQLADLSLLAGAGRNLEQIDTDVVESVCQELGVID